MNPEAIFTPARRRWLYLVGVAGLGVCGVYGLVTGEQAAAWAGLGAALCGMAAGNVHPTEGDDIEHQDDATDYDPTQLPSSEGA